MKQIRLRMTGTPRPALLALLVAAMAGSAPN